MATAFPTFRDPLLSLFQSAAAAVARRRDAGDKTATHPLLTAAAHVAGLRANPQGVSMPPVNAAPAANCAELGLQYLEALVKGDKVVAQEIRDRLSFSECDPLWAETLVDYVKDFTLDGKPKPIPYIRYNALSDFVVAAPAVKMRVALISDWGTGTDEARHVIELLARQQPDIVIHLGDIYFAGTAEECEAHFFKPMRDVLPKQRLFTLSGNHDVYSGGEGYYGLLQRLGQPASYFCLRSPDESWQILAGDTGLHDRDPFDETTALTSLDKDEELWHTDKLRGFPGRSIFLTHHQPFSAFREIGKLAQHDPVNPNLMASYGRLVEAGRIDAWFWGHEHSLRIYAPYRGIMAGRNIGYGAIPEAAQEMVLAGLVDPPALLTEVKLDVVDGAYTHGFALLDLDAGSIEASYWAVTRPERPVYREQLNAAVGLRTY